VSAVAEENGAEALPPGSLANRLESVRRRDRANAQGTAPGCAGDRLLGDVALHPELGADIQRTLERWMRA
jgi:hypothetical protein